MNIALERIIEGIVATLRTDVIPHVADSYGKGQAIGVIDLLNAIAPRIEWAREPLQERVEARRTVLARSASALGRSDLEPGTFDTASASTQALVAELDRLDAAIGDLVGTLAGQAGRDGANAAVLALVKAHIHDDITAEMKRTRKPLFAEIASGGAKSG